LGIGSDGRLPITILPVDGTVYLGRMICLTNSLPGVYSKNSVISSPIFFDPSSICAGSMISC